MVHGAADPRTHGGEASHREVGHIPRLKEKKAAVSLEQLCFNEEEMEQEDREECSHPSRLLS